MLRIVSVLSLSMAIVWLSGCACCPKKDECPSTAMCPAPCPQDIDACALPPNAKPGECYAKVYIPPQYETYTERVCVREASEQLEVVPAQYEWVEERICVKDACEELRVTPAQFACREEKVLVQPSYTEWQVNKQPQCVAFPGQPAQDVFCLVQHPCVEKTIARTVMERPPCAEKVTIPAEYQTVRRQKLVCPATTRKVTIPAEFADVQKTRKVCDAKVVWRRVPCDVPTGGVVSLPGEQCPPFPLTPPVPVGSQTITPHR
ncbi:MAG: hypothetical protein GX547_13415 [Phycisphaerae bacterium]|nr:hypothetical protein [Phycisphaerae bacterium]